MSQDILVVDDEVGIRELLYEILVDEGFRVRVAENAAVARAFREEKRPDLVLLDIWMPETDGVTLLKEWASQGDLTMPVVMMSGHATIDTAVEATKIGAVAFLEKPIALPKLLATIQSALEKGKRKFQEGLQFEHLGRSGIMLDLGKKLEALAQRTHPVLICGEDGAGAELAARVLHHSGSWLCPTDFAWLIENPYLVLPDVEEGSLFLRDIGLLDRAMQRGLSQLLPKLERQKTRLIAATTRSPAELLQSETFDAELLGRISPVLVEIPPLRDHPEDIPDIADTILKQQIAGREVPPVKWSREALQRLKDYDWRGNLLTLTNAVRSAALEASEGSISEALIQRIAAPFAGVGKSAPLPIEYDLPLREARDRFEQAYLEHHIRKEAGNMSRVAEKVGLERTHLYRKLKQLGVKPGGRDDPT